MNTTPTKQSLTSAMHDQDIGFILKHLAQHETAQTMDEIRDRQSFVEVFTAWFAPWECRKAVVTAYNPVFLRWLYGKPEFRSVFEPLAHPLAAAVASMLPTATFASNIEAIELLLSSWVFVDHLTDAQRIYAMENSIKMVRDPAVVHIFLAHGAHPPPLNYERVGSLCTDRVSARIQSAPIPIDDTGLFSAAIYGKCSVKDVLALLEEGVRPRRDALLCAAQRGRLDILRTLVVDGMADMDGLCDGATRPVIHAIKRGWIQRGFTKTPRFEAVDMLLTLGVDVNGRDSDGKTLLGRSLLARDYKMVKLLLHHGADANIVEAGFSPVGFTPLFALCRGIIKTRLHCECIKLVLSGGADPNWQVGSGDAPLHRLASQGQCEKRFEMLKLLLQAGGNIHLRNHRAVTPLDLLEASAPERVAQLQQMQLL